MTARVFINEASAQLWWPTRANTSQLSRLPRPFRSFAGRAPRTARSRRSVSTLPLLASQEVLEAMSTPSFGLPPPRPRAACGLCDPFHRAARPKRAGPPALSLLHLPSVPSTHSYENPQIARCALLLASPSSLWQRRSPRPATTGSRSARRSSARSTRPRRRAMIICFRTTSGGCTRALGARLQTGSPGTDADFGRASRSQTTEATGLSGNELSWEYVVWSVRARTS